MKEEFLVELQIRVLTRIGNPEDVAWLRAKVPETMSYILNPHTKRYDTAKIAVFKTSFNAFSEEQKKLGNEFFEGPVKELVRQMGTHLPGLWTARQAASIAGQALSNPDNKIKAQRLPMFKGLKSWRILYT